MICGKGIVAVVLRVLLFGFQCFAKMRNAVYMGWLLVRRHAESCVGSHSWHTLIFLIFMIITMVFLIFAAIIKQIIINEKTTISFFDARMCRAKYVGRERNHHDHKQVLW